MFLVVFILIPLMIVLSIANRGLIGGILHIGLFFLYSFLVFLCITTAGAFIPVAIIIVIATWNIFSKYSEISFLKYNQKWNPKKTNTLLEGSKKIPLYQWYSLNQMEMLIRPWYKNPKDAIGFLEAAGVFEYDKYTKKWRRIK